jgi:hypothetical protein
MSTLVKEAFVRFAEQTGKQDNEEMLLYFSAGWQAAEYHIAHMITAELEKGGEE